MNETSKQIDAMAEALANNAQAMKTAKESATKLCAVIAKPLCDNGFGGVCIEVRPREYVIACYETQLRYCENNEGHDASNLDQFDSLELFNELLAGGMLDTIREFVEAKTLKLKSNVSRFESTLQEVQS